MLLRFRVSIIIDMLSSCGAMSGYFTQMRILGFDNECKSSLPTSARGTLVLSVGVLAPCRLATAWAASLVRISLMVFAGRHAQ